MWIFIINNDDHRSYYLDHTLYNNNLALLIYLLEFKC